MPRADSAAPDALRADARDVIDEALGELARRRAKWLGDDVAAIELLTALIAEAERVLTQRVRGAPSNGYSRQAIADALRNAPNE
jgi:hypothetical protein